VGHAQCCADCALCRLGICYGSPALIQIINNTKAPYNISVPTAHLASLALSPEGLDLMRSNVRLLMENRDELIAGLKQLQCTGEILGANDANFVLVQVLDKARADGGRPSGERAEMCYKRMAEERGLVVRNRSKVRMRRRVWLKARLTPHCRSSAALDVLELQWAPRRRTRSV
jgi:histidinol-phosphate aminotransferase